MKPISEELVEDSWQEVAMFNQSQISKGMKDASKQQPHLFAFMMAFTQDLDQEVKELAIYMFYNVYRIFKVSYKKRLNKISSKDIIKCYEHNEQFIENLNGTHDKFIDRIGRNQGSEQPYVMKYVLETLFEAPDGEEPVELTEEDTGYLFMLFKTVIELLNETTNA
jgi:hypothetical protein